LSIIDDRDDVANQTVIDAAIARPTMKIGEEL
jgi:hypothetical protein